MPDALAAVAAFAVRAGLWAAAAFRERRPDVTVGVPHAATHRIAPRRVAARPR